MSRQLSRRPIVHRAPEPEELTRAVGVITDVSKASKDANGKWDNRKTFSMWLPRSKTSITCKYTSTSYCPLDKGDRVSVVGIYDEKSKTIVTLERPIISVSNERESLVNAIAKGLIDKSSRWKTNLILANHTKSNNVYDEISQVTALDVEYDAIEEGARVSLWLSKQAWAYRSFGVNSMSGVSLLTTDERINLLSYWYNDRDLRQLLMLGIDENSGLIEGSMLSPCALYEQIRRNPCAIPNLTEEKIQELVDKLDLEIKAKHYRAHAFLNLLYNNVVKNHWTCTPIKVIKRKFPDYEALLRFMLPKEQKNAENYEQFKTIKLTDYRIFLVEDQYIYFDWTYDPERTIYEKFYDMIKDPDFNEAVANQEIYYHRQNLSADQITAIKGSLATPISIITGPGGSGKTTIMAEIVRNLIRRGCKIGVASFTGKAVARAKQALKGEGIDAHTLANRITTLHGMLGGRMNRDVTHLIVDEASMLAGDLFARVLREYPIVQLLLVGDCNQLPPMSFGAVFYQASISATIPVFRLVNNHRVLKFKDNLENGIAVNCNLIANSNPAPGTFRFKSAHNVQIINGGIDAVKDIIRACLGEIKDYNITVVTPVNADRIAINKFCQDLIRNKDPKIKDVDNKIWALNDRVVLNKNRITEDIMNGEEGRIIELGVGCIYVSFADEAIAMEDLAIYARTHRFYTGQPIDSNKMYTNLLDLGYAGTVHKMQGCQCETIIYYTGMERKASAGFYDRTMTYTAVSRAMLSLFLVGNIKHMQASVECLPRMRHEMLGKWLAKGLEETQSGLDNRLVVQGSVSMHELDALMFDDFEF